MKSNHFGNLSAVLPESLDSKVLQDGLCVAYLQALRKLAVVHEDDDRPETVWFVASHGVTGAKGQADTRPVMVEMPLDALLALPTVPVGKVKVRVSEKWEKDVFSGEAHAEKAGLPYWKRNARFAEGDSLSEDHRQ